MAEDVQISGIFVKAEDVQISGIFVSRCFCQRPKKCMRFVFLHTCIHRFCAKSRFSHDEAHIITRFIRIMLL